jgi:GTPase SAR1 family protein
MQQTTHHCGQVLFGASDELRLLTTTHRKLNLLKIVLTGDGRGGKTSLLRCLRGEPFNEVEPSTCGVELCTVDVGAEKWAASDLAAVGDFAALLADEFRAQQRVSTAAPAAVEPSSDNAVLVSSPAPPASKASARAESPLQDGPIAITSDLPPLLCVAERSELSLTVRVSGGTPSEPLQYRWSRNGAVVDGETSNTLRIAHAARSAAGEYCVEVYCQSQPTPVKSSVAKVRIVSSVMDKVNTILLEHGESLTDDKPKAIVFDCGGQRMYYSVQQLLLTESLTLYVIVVSLADDLDDPLTCDEDLKYSMTHRQNLIFWLNTIFSLAPGAKIIVVCTKVDMLSDGVRQQRLADVKECVKRTLAYARGRIAGVLPVSSKTSEGFDALLSKMEELRPTLDRYGEPVPACWFKFLSIAQELVKQGLQRISYTEAQQIARQCGILVDNDVRAMLQRFNDAGLLLWRSDELQTQVLVILDTAWLVDLMTKVSCTRHIKSIKELIEFTPRSRDESKLDALLSGGRLSESILDLLWPVLSPDERPTVLQYLVTFGVCSKLRRHHATSASDTYLVPALFPKSARPELSDEFASWPELRIPFRPTDCEPDIQELRFLPDTLFFKIVARLLQQVDVESSQRSELFIDRVEVHAHDTRFILHHSHPTESLTLKAFPGDDAPRIALGRICAILDRLAHQNRLKYSLHVHCLRMGKLGYYEIRDRSIRDLEAAKAWSQEPLQPERDTAQCGLSAAATVSLDGKGCQSADWKPLPEGKRFHFFLSHKQQGADGYAALVKEKLKALGYSCWIDTEQTADRKGMEAGVEGSVCVLLFLFKGTLHRPYRLFELRLARAYGVPVIALLEGDHYRETYSSVLDLQSAFDSGELPADPKPVVDKADFNFFYRRQQHEHALMISRLCEKLEAAMATGDWPSFTQAPDASGKAVEAAYRMLDAELRAGAATAAPSVQQSTPNPPAPIRNLGKPADAVPTEECKWAGFISHHQTRASRTVQLLKEWIEKRLKERRHRLTEVWVDKQQRATPDGMNEGVLLSRNFILFLTKDVLAREWCLNEIRSALKHRKNVILVYETNEDCGGVSGTFATFYDPELRKAFPHAEDYAWLMKNSYVPFHDRGHHIDVMLCDPKCKNGILDQMQLEEAESAVAADDLAQTSCAPGGADDGSGPSKASSRRARRRGLSHAPCTYSGSSYGSAMSTHPCAMSVVCWTRRCMV